MTIERVHIELAERGYDILIGADILGRAETYAGLPAGSVAAIVTNETVAPLYAERLAQALRATFHEVRVIVLPDGEAHKGWPALNSIFDAMLGSACDRKTVVFALGGGVVGDMAGFAAACYMRGVPYVQVPTTLLAQVDSSVGGKTAINHPLGKNMIGVFNQPLRVVADLDTLDTLPQRELIAGLAEIIKYGPIADNEFLDWIASNLDALKQRDKAALAHAVKRSCEIKAAVVAQDERESNLRAILNLGHTFGHAIEAGLGFGAWLHGEAVGCGMVMAADLSQRLGLIPSAYAQRLRELIDRAGLPVVGPRLGVERYLQLMRLDKKSEAGEIRFVVIEAPGRAAVRGAPDAVVRQTLEACTRVTAGLSATSLRPGASEPAQTPRPAPRRVARTDPQRLPARPRPNCPQQCVPAAWSTRRRCSSITRVTCFARGSRIRWKWRSSPVRSREPCA